MSILQYGWCVEACEGDSVRLSIDGISDFTSPICRRCRGTMTYPRQGTLRRQVWRGGCRLSVGFCMIFRANRHNTCCRLRCLTSSRWPTPDAKQNGVWSRNSRVSTSPVTQFGGSGSSALIASFRGCYRLSCTPGLRAFWTSCNEVGGL